MRYSEEARALIEKNLKTGKQKSFQYNFFVDESKHEKGEDVKTVKRVRLRETSKLRWKIHQHIWMARASVRIE